jgi:NAD(P)H-hydrate epimerase
MNEQSNDRSATHLDDPVSLPRRLYTAAQTRALDAAAIEGHGVPGYTLMQRAGAACFDVIRTRWGRAKDLTVLCGGGNNGGDGYVIARLAAAAGLRVAVIALTDPECLTGDAATAFENCRQTDATVLAWDECPPQLPGQGPVVDAMLGTGLARQVGGRYRDAVECVNACGRPVVAVDIPSGLSADSGAVMGCAVRATLCVSFIGLKRGLLTGAAGDFVGELIFDDLSVPKVVYDEVISNCQLLDERALLDLPKRDVTSHKGSHGSVLVVGGNVGMTGAAILAGRAALRSGAGLVKVATHQDHAHQIPLAVPELMTVAVEDADALRSQWPWASVVALGPGLGQDDWARTLFDAALEAPLPLVVDADALNLLAGSNRQRDRWVLTPHPGEAARLLDTDAATIQADRFAAAEAIASRYQAVCVLKGSGTVVAAGGGFGVCVLGNAGMATAGMGDVLTGVISALMAQGASADMAARLGVCAHGYAGDLAALEGQRGLMAGDLIEQLRTAVNLTP